MNAVNHLELFATIPMRHLFTITQSSPLRGARMAQGIGVIWWARAQGALFWNKREAKLARLRRQTIQV
jgi:hypothetical protein